MSNQNNNKELKDPSTLTTERQHVVDVIQSVQQRIALLYHAYPIFCIGDMQDAFHPAFASNLNRKHRPLLIHIHHDNTLDLFSSIVLVEFLRENYIVWPWDISNPADRRILIKMWQENFPAESFIDFSMGQCPMLIGVMRSFTITSDSFPEYKSEVLMADNVLVRTNEEVDLERLLHQLIVFKEKFDKNERYLSSDFVQKIAKCPELVVEISEYLSLNDAVATFSPAVLPLLWRCKINLPVIKPSEEFLRIMTRTNNEDKILSLRFKADQFRKIMRPFSIDAYMNVRSLSLSGLQELRQMSEVKRYFPNVTHLSLHYDGEVDFHKLCKIFDRIPGSVKRFDIHCDSICCSHYRMDILFIKMNNFNTTVETFVLHMKYTSRSLVNKCFQTHQKCVLRTIIDFIKIMSNIRHIGVITKRSIEPLVDVVEWTTLMDMCRQVKRIHLRGMTNMCQNTQLLQNIQEIKNALHKIRETIKFDVQIK